MKLTRFRRITVPGATAGLMVVAVLLITGAVPGAAQNRHHGLLHIVKDSACTTNPANACQIVTSNLNELPAGSLSSTTSPGEARLSATVFWTVTYSSMSSPAIGQSAAALWTSTPCLEVCTLSYGSGQLATISARVDVTYQQGGDGALFDWDGTYSFNPPAIESKPATESGSGKDSAACSPR